MLNLRLASTVKTLKGAILLRVEKGHLPAVMGNPFISNTVWKIAAIVIVSP